MENDTDRLRQDLARLDGALQALTQLHNDITLWLDEESKGAARESLDNVISHLESEAAEFRKRRQTVIHQLRAHDFYIEF